MAEHGAGAFLHDGVILLGFALLFVLLFRRLGLGATLGYLVAGAVVGPQVLGLVGDAESMISIAELGIVLLLFVVGLELNPARLWRMRHVIFGFGLAQVVACGLAIFATILAITGYPLAAALAIGLPLGLSSTAQVLPMLQSAGRLRTPFGERAFGILLFQDLSIIPLITIVAALGSQSAPDDAMPGWQLAIVTIVVVIGLVAAGRFALRPLFRLIGGLGEREMFVVAGLFTVAGSALLMELIGLSTALGAFIAGVMLADTPYRHELEADIEPFRSILLGMFFLAVGMMLDLGAIADQPLFVIGMALVLISLKTAIIAALGMLFRMDWRNALALGLLLSQGGEFGFVLFTQARGAGIIDAETASLFGAIVTLSMATTPFLMIIARRFRNKGAATSEGREGPLDQHARALVVGYGRFGQGVAQMLMAGGISVTLIDRDVDRIDMSGEFGFKVYYGDGMRLDLLRQAGGGEAQLIMFCTDKDQVEPEFMSAVHEAFPQAAIYVRGFDRRSVMKLGRGPQEFVMREVYESAIRMALLGLDRMGLSAEQLDHAETVYRDMDRRRMRMQIDTGDIRAASESMVRSPDRNPLTDQAG
ncbi:monovalent cation:proton antiporter-2 (CPA2) family protein [Alteraurantiacibacter aestuarii]|uniref:Sodium:proton exchanger n=1 Tax=Alteraurantiacibacter aestuarii TaxID=650004 RepID=A0A844ZL53_9SPHN|nr:cation:proton antiporter [Alteraurantiacibacter aestuarii]MXO89161.1 sodium:proton exchanger [Alteraurantiacibacter aestuarii]